MNNAVLLLLMISCSLPIFSWAQTSTENHNDTINKVDPAGKKTGYWIEKQGEITYKGYYQDNNKVNNWIGFYPNNFIFKIDYFNNGLKDGISLQFDRRGKLIQFDQYSNGGLHGVSYDYGQGSVSPQTEINYKNGKKNGPLRQYYDNGKIQEDAYYIDDKKDGVSRWYGKNGNLVAEYNYRNGGLDGIQKTFFDNDTIQTLSTYINNQQTGDYKEFYRNGKAKISGKFVNSEKDGAWIEYDELGKQVRITRYKNGTEVKK
jgi:antitoxin component YwqK of YwqJK toxin-antitoxin module